MSLRQALVSACLLALTPRTASAVQFEIFIDVELEEDLYDLLATEQISASSFDALLLLHQSRVDLNLASRERLYLLPNLDYAQVDRILVHRDRVGTIRDLQELVAAGILDAELARSVRAFVLVRPLDESAGAVHGLARMQARWSGRYDRLPPAAAAQVRVQALRHLDAGLSALLTRNQLGRVRWDSGRQALSAEPERTRFVLPKLYVEWEDEKREVVAGTYRIGFGQRLTFDVTDQMTPNGFFGDYELRRPGELVLACRRAAGESARAPCRSDRVERVTPDYDWTNRLAGGALGLKQISAGPGWLQLYLWGSYQVHRVPRIELFVRSSCNDPRQNEEPGCAAPETYIRTGALDAPANLATYASLPAMFAEGLAGANASYFWGSRAHLGMTAYAAVPRWLPAGVALGFQELSRKPEGRVFGALGFDAAYGFRQQDFFAEFARSLAPGAGGNSYGLVLRSVTSLPTAEVEASLRAYGTQFVNPYARPISAPDELEGLRARDEAGVRVRVTSQLAERVTARLVADGWRRLSARGFNGLLFARVDIRVGASWLLGCWVEYRSTGGQRLLLATKLAFQPSRKLRSSIQLQHRALGWRLGNRAAQQDVAAILNLTARPIDLLRVRFRLRYDFDDISSRARLLQALWASLEVALSVRERDSLRIRYDMRLFLDQRESTRLREPNPEHWLRLEYLVRF